MALFDRRLLAYFDDATVGGGPTLVDRIYDHQRDLAEIERELKKYEHVLGRRAKVKSVNPEKWIAQQRSRPSIKERYSRVLHSPPYGGEAESQHFGVYASGGGGYGSGVTQPDVFSAQRETHAQSFGSSAYQQIHELGDHAQQGLPAGRRASRASIKKSSLARRSRASVVRPGHHVSISEPSPGNHSTMETTYVQVDTVFGLPAASKSTQHFTVEAEWNGHVESASRTEWRASRVSSSSSRDDCVVRQQLKLEGVAGKSVALIHVYKQGSLGAGTDEHIGSLEVDALNASNAVNREHELLDQHRRPTGITVLLRITRVNSRGETGARPSTTNEIDQGLAPEGAHGAPRSERRGSQKRGSAEPPLSRPSASEAGSAAETEQTSGVSPGVASFAGSDQPRKSNARASVVVQDPVAVPKIASGTRTSVAAASATAAPSQRRSITTTPAVLGGRKSVTSHTSEEQAEPSTSTGNHEQERRGSNASQTSNRRGSASNTAPASNVATAAVGGAAAVATVGVAAAGAAAVTTNKVEVRGNPKGPAGESSDTAGSDTGGETDGDGSYFEDEEGGEEEDRVDRSDESDNE